MAGNRRFAQDLFVANQRSGPLFNTSSGASSDPLGGEPGGDKPPAGGPGNPPVVNGGGDKPPAGGPGNPPPLPGGLLPSGVRPEDIAGFTPREIGEFAPDQFAAFPAKAMEGFTPGQVKVLPPEVFEEMRPDQFKNLDSKAVGVFSSEQLAEIPPKVIGKMNPDQFETLPLAALGGFQPVQVKKMKTDLFRGMAPQAFAEINPDAFAGFSPNKFNALPEELVSIIEPNQFGSFRPKLFKKMSSKLIDALKPESFEGLTIKQGNKMKPGIVEKFGYDQILSIPADALDAMPDASVDKMLEMFPDLGKLKNTLFSDYVRGVDPRTSLVEQGQDSAQFSSAYDLVEPGPSSGYSLTSSDYPNATSKEIDFLDQFSATCKSFVKISFEPDNGWMDVDGTSGNINLLLAGRSSSYLSTSPYYPSSTGRTTLLPGTATGRHNPNANAEATIQYLDTTSAGQGVRANFTLYNVGNIENGLDEAGLALKHSQVNIDRGTNTTSAGSSPDQFLEIAPSETAEGGLRVDFLGTDASGTAWSNPVYAFGFYLLGREAKRDVYLDVRDIYGNLIHSSVTTEGEIVTPTTSVEYITFQVDANENPVGSFELREEYNGEDVIWRDIFSVDDLSLYTGLTYSGSETSCDEITRSTPATSITDADYPNAKGRRDSFIGSIGAKSKETITFEPYNGWMDVNDPPGSLSIQNHQLLAGRSSAYATVSSTNIASGDAVTLKTGSNSGSHSTTSSRGANGEVIHMDQNGSKVSFTLTNVANYVGADEPDLARVHEFANIDRGINTTSGNAPDSGESYNQFLEILPNEKAEGQLKVSFEGTDSSGKSWSNPAYDLGFYLMGREIKRDVCLKVYDINGDLIHNEVTREPSTADRAVIQYFSFSVGEDDPISHFTLTECFNSGNTADQRDIFSIDDLTFSTIQDASAIV